MNTGSHQCAVAVDVMSGDYGLVSNLEAVLDIARLPQNSDVIFYVVGDERRIWIKGGDRLHARNNIEIVHCDDVIDMAESPKASLRRVTTISTCLNLIKEGKARACLSSGNTGALMMHAHLILKPIQGIDRVAICAAVPNSAGSSTYFLDLGANVECKPHHLSQFGMMASILYEVQEFKSRPRVGLLNIGSEDHKGGRDVKDAAILLDKSPDVNYIGYVEGYNLYDGSVDVVVTDGFTGNVALKSSEGAASFIKNKLRFNDNWIHDLCLIPALPFLWYFKRQIDPRRYNGASFLGLNGNVLKSHGNADKKGFSYSLKRSISQARAKLSREIAKRITQIQNGNES